MSTNSIPSQLTGDSDRNAIDITWSCIAVIFACVWKAVHPNVPPANSKWTPALRRLYMTLWTILLPELAILRAVAQWCEVRRISEAYKQQHLGNSSLSCAGARSSGDVAQSKEWRLYTFFPRLASQSDDVPRNEPQWTKVHSFFLAMGGFVTTRADGTPRTIRPADLGVVTEDSTNTAPKLLWPRVEEEEIKDKSKGDTITKALVVWQTTWFVVQLIARAVEGLAVTELEIMTLAYGLLCALLYGLWWNKPYDVQKPILIQSQLEESDLQEPTPTREPLKVSDFLLGVWIAQLDRIIFEGSFIESDVPLFDNVVSYIFLVTSATLLGCIHCIAWNFQFLTHTERLLWISSSSVVAATPFFLMVVTIIASLVSEIPDRFQITDDLSFLRRICYIGITKGPVLIHTLILSVSLYAYCIARIILIVEAFVLLRDLSPSATQSISWTRFIPHV